jgi:uncharacterized YccA/Bax inhibitor family protein
MDAGAAATLVAAIIGGGVTLAVAFQKSVLVQWRKISNKRKSAIQYMTGFITGLLTVALTPDFRSGIVAGVIILLTVVTLGLFLRPAPPQSN